MRRSLCSVILHPRMHSRHLLDAHVTDRRLRDREGYPTDIPIYEFNIRGLRLEYGKLTKGSLRRLAP
eukprot:46193-Eustigmatos_ZCMA.PRE.1